MRSVSLNTAVYWLVTPIAVLGVVVSSVTARPVVPGTGQRVFQVGDDFEDPNWEYVPRSPKSSRDLDEQPRLPTGVSKNGRWYEGLKRGHPDIVKRVPTPEGGLPGSTGAPLLRTLRSGVPGYYSYRMTQDDFIADCNYRLGGTIPVYQTPSVVVRVFMPPVDQWEDRTGPTFGFRGAVDTRIWKRSEGRRRPSSHMEREVYWPGMFVEFESKTDARYDKDYAYLRVRGNSRGGDMRGPQIKQTGWWTMGLSFTPDGQVHYYAKPGLDDLTEEDHITSQYPYSYRCERFRTFFFDVCNRDDGRTWSTPWIVDDAFVYYIGHGSQPSVASKP